MKIDDIVKYRGPQLVPLPTDPDDLSFLVPALLGAGYYHDGLTALFGNAWITFSELPGCVWRCERDGSPLSLLAKLWLLCQMVDRPAVEEIFGAEGLRSLIDRDIVTEHDDRVKARVDLYECLGSYVFTDHNVSVVRFTKHVYEPGADSYTCARATPRRSVKRTLDLCTGAGLHAIIAARHSDRVLGIDVNPRALAFARVNAALNGVRHRCRFLEGDLYAALPLREAPFDLIVANPPWIATPESDMQLYRWGGETGEALTRRIVEGLPEHLAPGGRLAMFVIYPVIRATPYLGRLRDWLGGGAGWGVTLVTFSVITLESFIGSQLAGKWDWSEHVAEFGRWMDMYAQHGIERMATGMVYVTRRDGALEWAFERSMPIPLCDVSGPIGRMLDALERIHDTDWPKEPLRLSREVAYFGVDPRTGAGRVEFEPGWGPAERLDKTTTDVVRRLMNAEPVGDVDLELLRSLAARRIIE